MGESTAEQQDKEAQQLHDQPHSEGGKPTFTQSEHDERSAYPRRSSIGGASADGLHFRANFSSTMGQTKRRSSIGGGLYPSLEEQATSNSTVQDPLAVAKQRRRSGCGSNNGDTESVCSEASHMTTPLVDDDGIPMWKKKLLEKKRTDSQAETAIDPNIPAWKRALLEKKRKNNFQDRQSIFTSSKQAGSSSATSTNNLSRSPARITSTFGLGSHSPKPASPSRNGASSLLRGTMKVPSSGSSTHSSLSRNSTASLSYPRVPSIHATSSSRSCYAGLSPRSPNTVNQGSSNSNLKETTKSMNHNSTSNSNLNNSSTSVGNKSTASSNKADPPVSPLSGEKDNENGGEEAATKTANDAELDQSQHDDDDDDEFDDISTSLSPLHKRGFISCSNDDTSSSSLSDLSFLTEKTTKVHNCRTDVGTLVPILSGGKLDETEESVSEREPSIKDRKVKDSSEASKGNQSGKENVGKGPLEGGDNKNEKNEVEKDPPVQEQEQGKQQGEVNDEKKDSSGAKGQKPKQKEQGDVKGEQARPPESSKSPEETKAKEKTINPKGGKRATTNSLPEPEGNNLSRQLSVRAGVGVPKDDVVESSSSEGKASRHSRSSGPKQKPRGPASNGGTPKEVVSSSSSTGKANKHPQVSAPQQTPRTPTKVTVKKQIPGTPNKTANSKKVVAPSSLPSAESSSGAIISAASSTATPKSGHSTASSDKAKSSHSSPTLADEETSSRPHLSRSLTPPANCLENIKAAHPVKVSAPRRKKVVNNAETSSQKKQQAQQGQQAAPSTPKQVQQAAPTAANQVQQAAPSTPKQVQQDAPSTPKSNKRSVSGNLPQSPHLVQAKGTVVGQPTNPSTPKSSKKKSVATNIPKSPSLASKGTVSSQASGSSTPKSSRKKISVADLPPSPSLQASLQAKGASNGTHPKTMRRQSLAGGVPPSPSLQARRRGSVAGTLRAPTENIPATSPGRATVFGIAQVDPVPGTRTLIPARLVPKTPPGRPGTAKVSATASHPHTDGKHGTAKVSATVSHPHTDGKHGTAKVSATVSHPHTDGKPGTAKASATVSHPLTDGKPGTARVSATVSHSHTDGKQGILKGSTATTKAQATSKAAANAAAAASQHVNGANGAKPTKLSVTSSTKTNKAIADGSNTARSRTLPSTSQGKQAPSTTKEVERKALPSSKRLGASVKKAASARNLGEAPPNQPSDAASPQEKKRRGLAKVFSSSRAIQT
ncbi:hypothetical protein ACA910_017202 [Epithemia clementina (nom. ined.)]